MATGAAEKDTGSNGGEVARVVHVGLGGRSYEIRIDTGLVKRAGTHIAEFNRGGNVVIVTDSNVAALYLDDVRKSCEEAGLTLAEPVILQPGEHTKNIEVWEDLVETLLARGVDRISTIVALGGGVIGDIVGFAASVVMRGVDFIQIPTSLLAQVDSSVGGKTGINSPLGKNLIGAFYQPVLVLSDCAVLETLPERELKAGYAEVVKYGLINRPDFFDWLEDSHGADVLKCDYETIGAAVETSCRDKAEIVERDEREVGERALLNLGHTFGHAFERAGGYDGSLLHGEAVAIGVVCAFDLSVRMGLCPPEDLERVRKHLQAVGLPVRMADIAAASQWTPDELILHMQFDKKTRAGRKTFILVHGIGKAFMTSEVDEDLVKAVLVDCLKPRNASAMPETE